MSEIDKVLNERHKVYGEFSDVATLSQGLKQVVRTHTTWDTLTASQHEAIELILHKIARIVNGNSFYIDSWRDIVGYAQLELDILSSDSRAIDTEVRPKV